MTYASVREELGEEPHVCKRGKVYMTRTNVFDLLFLSQFEADNQLKQGWQKQLHLHALKLLKNRLELEDFENLIRWMRFLFKRYCLCIPNMSKDRWLANSAQSKFKPSWIGFDKNGDRMDYPNIELDSSWFQRRRIRNIPEWKMTCDEITSEEGLRIARESLRKE